MFGIGWKPWLILVALWLMSHYYASFEREISDDLYLEMNIGAIALIVLLALSVNCAENIASPG